MSAERSGGGRHHQMPLRGREAHFRTLALLRGLRAATPPQTAAEGRKEARLVVVSKRPVEAA